MNLYINRVQPTGVDGLFVRPLSARHALEMDKHEGHDKMGVVLCGGLCDADGNLVFKDSESAMVAVPWDMCWDLFGKIMSASGFAKDAIDDAEKNSETAG